LWHSGSSAQRWPVRLSVTVLNALTSNEAANASDPINDIAKARRRLLAHLMLRTNDIALSSLVARFALAAGAAFRQFG
jgi:hypothetical protein